MDFHSPTAMKPNRIAGCMKMAPRITKIIETTISITCTINCGKMKYFFSWKKSIFVFFIFCFVAAIVCSPWQRHKGNKLQWRVQLWRVLMRSHRLLGCCGTHFSIKFHFSLELDFLCCCHPLPLGRSGKARRTTSLSKNTNCFVASLKLN